MSTVPAIQAQGPDSIPSRHAKAHPVGMHLLDAWGIAGVAELAGQPV